MRLDLQCIFCFVSTILYQQDMRVHAHAVLQYNYVPTPIDFELEVPTFVFRVTDCSPATSECFVWMGEEKVKEFSLLGVLVGEKGNGRASWPLQV